jgi:hypothetical protein
MQARVPSNWPSQHQDPSVDVSSRQTLAGTDDNTSSATAPARIVDKMLRNLWLVGYIHMLLPESCIVHVMRHPMDVALSCYAQPFGYSGSAMAWSWDLAAIATQIEMTWEVAEHWEQHLPGRVNTGGWRCSVLAIVWVVVLFGRRLHESSVRMHGLPACISSPCGILA